MMTMRFWRAAAGCLVLIGGCERSAPRDDAAARAGVEALVKEWAAAGQEGRWSDLAALYADDPGFVWIEQGRVAYADHAAVVAGVEAAQAMKAEIRSAVSNVAVTPLAPDVAAYRANATLSVSSASFSFAVDGVLSGVAVKRDGAWKLLQGHLSAPQPAAAPDAAPATPTPR